jgi:PAS domain S-box-containing protein
VFGYEPRRLIGAPVELLMPERFRTGHTSLFKAYFSAPLPRPMGADLRLYGRRQDGSEFPIEISLSPLEDDPNIYVTCAIRDVSDRHKMEAQLRTMASEAERANTVKSRFLAAASHDLRQPLQAATLYLSVLTRQAETPDQQGLCAKMRAPLEVMSGILDALLDISMLDSGLVTPKRNDFALAPILERIAVDLRPVAQQKNLSFDFSQTLVQGVVGVALVIASGLYALQNLNLMPGGGSALSLAPSWIGVAVAAHVVLGALMTFGIGLYAPSLIMLSLMGLDPKAAFPIMMGACAFLMPVSGIRFMNTDRIDMRVVLGIALGGTPAVLIAAYAVTSMPLVYLRWGVVAVVLYAAVVLLRSALRPAAATNAVSVASS